MLHSIGWTIGGILRHLIPQIQPVSILLYQMSNVKGTDTTENQIKDFFCFQDKMVEIYFNIYDIINTMLPNTPTPPEGYLWQWAVLFNYFSEERSREQSLE